MRRTIDHQDTYRRAADLRRGDVISDPVGKRGAVLTLVTEGVVVLGSRTDVELDVRDVDTGETRTLVLHGDHRVRLARRF